MRSGTTTAGLPTELWSEILEDVYADTGTQGLYNVSMTSRHFHSLARALIFRSYVVNCYGDEIELSSHFGARLGFYSSDAIAPFVRNVGIFVLLGIQWPAFPNLVAKIFDAIPRFTNITSFSCTGVNFTEFALRQVSTLSSLEFLSVSDCSAPPKTDSLPMLRPRSFVYLGGVRPVAHRWLALLDPDCLRVLRVAFTGDLSSFFVNHPSPYPFPSLHVIHLHPLDETLSELPMLPILLSNTPTLRRLKLFPYFSDPEQYIRTVEGLVSPAVCQVPYLEDYHGPHKLLPIILGRGMGSPPASLRRVLLEGVDEAEDALESVMNSFRSCHQPQLRALTHLHISLLKSMDLQFLATLRDVFPVLQVLRLHASEHYTRPAFAHNVELTDLYPLPLPNTLVSLSIQWISDRNSQVVPDLEAAKDNLVPRLPNLRRLWLYDISKLALLWRRTASRSEERCTLHEVGSKDDVWRMNEVLVPECTFFQR